MTPSIRLLVPRDQGKLASPDATSRAAPPGSPKHATTVAPTELPSRLSPGPAPTGNRPSLKTPGTLSKCTGVMRLAPPQASAADSPSPCRPLPATRCRCCPLRTHTPRPLSSSSPGTTGSGLAGSRCACRLPLSPGVWRVCASRPGPQDGEAANSQPGHRAGRGSRQQVPA